MKPLLVIPPAPLRWPSLQELGLPADPLWQADLEKRFVHGLPGSQDAFALAGEGSRLRACAAICKRHDLGVLNRVHVRPEVREAGLVEPLLEALLAWFEMTGGKWLFTTTTADLAETSLRKYDFAILRRLPRSPHDAVVALRAPAGAPDPLETATGSCAIHDVSRVNWPTMACLLYNRPGPDPRVPLEDSAVTAETTALELIAQQERGTCQLKAAFRGPRLVGLASVATDTLGQRTYAMIMPHSEAPSELRDAVLAFAGAKGYQHVDFPLEALAAGSPVSAPTGARQTDRREPLAPEPEPPPAATDAGLAQAAQPGEPAAAAAPAVEPPEAESPPVPDTPGAEWADAGTLPAGGEPHERGT